jgi:1-aminocyclopropane-1-carboxylate deaminase/D-cysteine desulfhydrase-like pyridoxal-dependent ACC family enzyme
VISDNALPWVLVAAGSVGTLLGLVLGVAVTRPCIRLVRRWGR